MKEILAQFNWWSVADITLVAIAIYYFLLLIKRTQAAQMFTGFFMLVGIFLLSSIFPLTTVNWVVTKLYSSVILILIILFQDDIRIFLRRLGRKPFLEETWSSSDHLIDSVVKATSSLAKARVGAIIVFERKIILNQYTTTGTILEARASRELLESIFQPKSPLHDGAVIIQDNRLVAAGCFLPLASTVLPTGLGTRHSAGIGITEVSDALAVIVSEERGSVNFVNDGEISQDVTPAQLRKLLDVYYRLETQNQSDTPARKALR